MTATTTKVAQVAREPFTANAGSRQRYAGDLRKPEYAYKQVQVDKTIPDTRKALFEYGTNYRDVGSMMVDLDWPRRKPDTR
jgi:hypothetical protein